MSKTILLVAIIGLRTELNRRPQIVPYKLVALAGSATLLKICLSYYLKNTKSSKNAKKIPT